MRVPNFAPNALGIYNAADLASELDRIEAIATAGSHQGITIQGMKDAGVKVLGPWDAFGHRVRAAALGFPRARVSAPIFISILLPYIYKQS
eukprot:607217-Pyramimonas_sp.AAC.1